MYSNMGSFLYYSQVPWKPALSLSIIIIINSSSIIIFTIISIIIIIFIIINQYYPYYYQSGTKPNLVAKIWLPTLVAICDGLPKLIANISSHIHNLVNTGFDVGSLVKWLPI